MKNILLVGPGGDSCSSARESEEERIKKKFSEVNIESISPMENRGSDAKTPDIVIGYDSTLKGGNVIEGTSKIAAFLENFGGRVIMIINISSDEIAVIHQGVFINKGGTKVGEALQKLLNILD